MGWQVARARVTCTAIRAGETTVLGSPDGRLANFFTSPYLCGL